jgi:hypothetical protein
MDERPPARPTQPATNSPTPRGPAPTGNPIMAPGSLPVVHAPSLIPDVLSLHNVVLSRHMPPLR